MAAFTSFPLNVTIAMVSTSKPGTVNIHQVIPHEENPRVSMRQLFAR